jgi:membrane protease YdiL (CAAX protease family)
MMATRTPRDLSSYLRIARPEHGAVWRLVVGLVVATVGFFAVTLVALLAVVLGIRLGGGHLVLDTDRITPELLLATNLGLALCIPLAGLLSWSIYGLKLRWLSSLAPGLRWRWLATCTAIAGTVWGVMFLLAMLAVSVSEDARVDGEVMAYLTIALLTTPLQAAGEEYLFRGYLLQSLGATRLAAPVCWVVSGAIFATAHGQFDPPLFADRWLIGIVFAWLATSTGGLEASIALHAVKNVTVLIPAVILGELSGAIDPTGVTWLPLGLDAVMLGISGWWIRSRYRRQTLPPPPPEVEPAGLRAG